MNLREFIALEVLSIASTIHRVDGEYQASSAEMCAVFNEDERFARERTIMEFTPNVMGQTMGHLAANGYWLRTNRPALVQRVGRKRWQLTTAGVDVLCA